MRPVPQAAIDLIKRFEGCKLKAYRDVGGKWTIGYGHTGRDVHDGLVWTQEQADAVLEDDIERHAALIPKVCKTVDLLTDNQYAALVSFVFNVGADPKWKIWGHLNRKEFDQARSQLLKFIYCNGVAYAGLQNRRAAEVALWMKDEPGSIPVNLPSSYTRDAPTPPVKSNPTPVYKRPAFLAVIAPFILGAPEAITKVTEALSPYASNPTAGHFIQWLAGAAPIAAALSAGLLAYEQRKQNN